MVEVDRDRVDDLREAVDLLRSGHRGRAHHHRAVPLRPRDHGMHAHAARRARAEREPVDVDLARARSTHRFADLRRERRARGARLVGRRESRGRAQPEFVAPRRRLRTRAPRRRRPHAPRAWRRAQRLGQRGGGSGASRDVAHVVFARLRLAARNLLRIARPTRAPSARAPAPPRRDRPDRRPRARAWS